MEIRPFDSDRLELRGVKFLSAVAPLPKALHSHSPWRVASVRNIRRQPRLDG